MTGIWVGAGFFAFVLTAVAVAGYLYQRLAERRDVEAGGPLLAGDRQPRRSAAFANLFQSIGENFPAAKNEQNPYRMRLSAAGYRWPSALPIFYGIKCGSALFFAGLFGILRVALPAAILPLTPLPMICGLGLGFLLPDRVLNSRVQARAQRLRSAVPPALDLMVLAMEAGQAIDQSIADASRGLKRTHPDLSALRSSMPSRREQLAPQPAVTSSTNAAVTGLGSALPARVVENAEINARIGVNDDWIVRRTGIRERRYADPAASLVTLASEAGAAALADAELDGEELDLVLVASRSQDSAMPNAAPQVAHTLGAEGAAAFDVGSACTGFLCARRRAGDAAERRGAQLAGDRRRDHVAPRRPD